MKYDDASWHSGGDFPADSPPEFGGTHIALFLRWCFSKGWAGKLHIETARLDVNQVIEGTMSATEFLFKHCDGKLIDEDLNEAGNDFAAQYYGKTGLYLTDYAGVFSELTYVAPESAHDFSLFSTMLEERFNSGVLTEGQADRKAP